MNAVTMNEYKKLRRNIFFFYLNTLIRTIILRLVAYCSTNEISSCYIKDVPICISV